MARTSIKYVHWKIFFDGVEVPWVDFSVQTGVDSPGEATVSLPPDPLLIHQRARTKVHIFMFDEHEEGVTENNKASDLKGYKLYWEGETAAISDNETPTSRQFSVVARGILAGLAKTKAFMLGAGAIGATPLVAGSSLLWSPGISAKTLVSLSSLAASFDVNNSTGSKSYAERALRLVAFLSSHNAWLRMHAARTGLMGKIAGLEDLTLTRLIPRVIASPYFKQVSEGIGQDSSALDVLATFNTSVFHHFNSTTLPKFDCFPPDGEEKIYPLGAEDDRYSFTRSFLRNDYFILPETYYAIPPSCNLIFPEMQASFGVQRNFDGEPTRAAVVDTQLATSLVVIAPDDLFRYEKESTTGMRPEEAWGVNWGDKAANASKSPYLSPSGTNLFVALSDLELERGITPLMSVPPFQVFSALANVYNVSTTSGKEALSNTVRNYGEMTLRGDSASQDQSYVYILKTLADYNLTLVRFTRQSSLAMIGHRWLVPGFPAVILRKNGSYLAYVRGHRFSVDANGQESSAVDLDYVRPFPRSTIDAVGVAAEIEEAVQSLDTNRKYLLGEYDRLKDDLKQLYDAARRLHSSEAKALAARYAYANALQSLLWKINPEEARRLWEVGQQFTTAANVSIDREMLSRIDAFYGLVISGIDEKRGKAVSATAREQFEDFGDARIQAAVSALLDAMTLVGSSVSKTTALKKEFAYPPVFANPALTQVESAEDIYFKLFGAQRSFTNRSKRTESFASVNDTEVARLNLRAFSSFTAYMNALAGVFPISSDAAATEWGARAEEDERFESVRDWEERTFLRRTDMQSLAQFATFSDLIVAEETSLNPSPTPFYVLRPNVKTTIESTSGKKMEWDDTIFSMVVAEKADDPEIRRLRESVNDAGLTTAERQRFWIEYAIRHWGSRAHDLS